MTSRRQAVVIGTRDEALEKMLLSSGLAVSFVSPASFGTLLAPSWHAAELVVVDLRAIPVLPSALAQLRRQHPRVAVLIVASTLDPKLMLDAMRAGVTEWAAEPLSQSDIEAAVSRLLAGRQARVIGQVFAFIGAKGGVGTTTLAVNVATALAKIAPERTLLIDLHLAHGDAALFLGAQPRFSVLDALENTHRLDESLFRGLITKTKAGPDLLASSDHPAVSATSPDRIRTLIEFASTLYEYVVLDVPRSDTTCLESLDVAKGVVVVANQELATARGASRVAGALRQRYGSDRVSVVVARYDPSADIGQHDVERVSGIKVLSSIPSDYRSAVHALNQGRPLVLDNHNALATSLEELAKSLAGVSSQTVDAPESGGLIGKLTHWRRTPR